MSEVREEIKSLREKGGWSIDEVSSFFEVSRGTAYGWWRGETVPPDEVTAVLRVLGREVRTRWQTTCKNEFEEWLERTAEMGVAGYVRRIANRHGDQTAREVLVQRAEEADGLVIASRRRGALAYVIPFTVEALNVLTEALLGMRKKLESMRSGSDGEPVPSDVLPLES